MTGWGIDYILDEITLDELVLIYKYGIEFEKTKSIILLNTFAEALTGKGKKKEIGDKPDLKKFYKLYGDKIKTPNTPKKE